jgi:uncharacterized protein (TIGR03085 family)
MPTLPPHRAEREALCDLFLTLGPDAPTLDEGWTTEDLAAHLYVREHNPVATAGILIKPLAELHDRGIASVKQRMAYEEVVERVRVGPPGPMRLVDGLVNLQEIFVHHEDARRGAGDHTPRPADEIDDVERALWQGLQRTARFMTRRIKGVAVDLVADDGAMIRMGRSAQRATLVGRPGELVLYLVGRGEAADVRIECSDAGRTALDEASLGI